MNSGKYSYLVKNTGLFAISVFSSKILVFLLIPFYTRVLSTEDYGVADLVITSVTLLIYFFTVNISDAVLRFGLDKNINKQSIFDVGLNVFAYGSFVLLICLGLSRFLNIFNWPAYYYILFYFYYCNVAFYQLITNFMRAIDCIKEVAIAGVVITISTVITSVICLFIFDLKLIGYFLSLIVSNMIAIIYCINCIKDIYRINFWGKIESATRREMCLYSMPLIINGVAWWVNNSIEKFFVLSICGLTANGIFAAALKIPNILTVFQQIFAQSWGLSAIKEFDKNDRDGFFSKTYALYDSFLVTITSILILINIPLCKLLFADKFFVAWKSSSILLLSVIFTALSGFIGSIFVAVKESKIIAISTVFAAIFNIVLNYNLLPLLEIMGASISMVASFVIVWFIRLQYSKKFIKLRINYRKVCINYSLLFMQVVIEHMLSNYMMVILQFAVSMLIMFNNKQFITHLVELSYTSYKKVINKLLEYLKRYKK